jgi:hypothetical protein
MNLLHIGTMTLILILIAAILLGVPTLMAIIKIIKVSTSDKITFIKGDKQVTVSSSHLSAEDKRNLVNF